MAECPKCHHDNPDNTRFCGNCGAPLPGPGETPGSRTETLKASVPDWKTGRRLAGRYEIIEELGKGGMGKVYKAYDHEINEKIALKIIRPEIAGNKKIITRFHNELKIARKISHRNVCRMFDLGRDEETKFITMEYVSGEDLKKSIRRMGPLTTPRALSIARQICRGLAEAHQLGIVHQDLKPHNIMIDREGIVRIMDFGIALSRELGGTAGSGKLAGTPQYMSPEQVEGREVDRRADIFSLGVILFEMVTGQVPSGGETAAAIAANKRRIPDDPGRLNTQVPEKLSLLILRCLEKDPFSRFQSAGELDAALARVEEELPAGESRFSRENTLQKMAARRLKLTGWPGAVVSAGLIIVAVYALFDRLVKTEGPALVPPSGIHWKNSIAVLLFRDLSPDKDQDPFCIGITESIIRNLHKFPELRVIPLTTMLAYQGTGKGVKEIGDDLKVAHVLDGTLLIEGDTLRISSHLSSVESGAVIWTDSYKRRRVGELELQDDISKSIAKALGVQLVDERYGAQKGPYSSDPKANEYYNYGRYFEVRFYETKNKEDFTNAVGNYSNAVDRDPGFALAFWSLGNIYYQWYFESLDKAHLELSHEYFQNAYEINNALAEVNTGLGWIYFNKQDMDRAYQYFRRAHELDPNNAEVNFHLGSFLRSIGLYKKAAGYYEKALEINPMPAEFCTWHFLRARCFSYTGRFEEAAVFLRKAMEIKPDQLLYTNYASQLIMMNRLEEAEEALGQARRLDPGHPWIRLNEALVFAAKGDQKRALALISNEDHHFGHDITSIFALLGMKDDAIKNIQKGIEEGFETSYEYLHTYLYLESNPCYDSLRSDPRFRDILKKEKRKYEEKLKKYRDL